MAILGQADLAANTNTLVGTIPAPGATVNVLAVNRTANPIPYSLALVPYGGTIGNSSWIEYATPLDGNQILERGGIPLSTGDMIYVKAASTGVSVTVVDALGA